MTCTFIKYASCIAIKYAPYGVLPSPGDSHDSNPVVSVGVGAAPPSMWVWVCFWGLENDILRFDYAGASESRVNVCENVLWNTFKLEPPGDLAVGYKWGGHRTLEPPGDLAVGYRWGGGGLSSPCTCYCFTRRNHHHHPNPRCIADPPPSHQQQQRNIHIYISVHIPIIRPRRNGKCRICMAWPILNINHDEPAVFTAVLQICVACELKASLSAKSHRN